MNEYLPRDTYSDIVTNTQYDRKVSRHHWEETDWEKTKLPYNFGDTGECPVRETSRMSSQQFTYEDFNIQPGTALKKKQSGIADPRFKRVINSGLGEEVEMKRVNEEAILQRTVSSREEEKLLSSETGVLGRSSKIPTFFTKKNSFTSKTNEITVINGNLVTRQCSIEKKSSEIPVKGSQNSIKVQNISSFTYNEENVENSTPTPAAPTPSDPPTPTPSQKVESSKSKVEQTQQQHLKKSVSDCTLHTKTTSMGDEDANDEVSTRLQSFNSATRMSKVNNWMKEFKPVPEKRRSVITVIGQTQGKSFSTILNEINQRRKLAKELDKHALCETILQTTDKENELTNLIAKVDFVSPDGKIVYSARKIYGYKETCNYDMVKNGVCEEYSFGNGELVKRGISYKMSDQIPERDVSSTLARKRKSKRVTKKSEYKRLDLKGVTNLVLESIQNQMVMSVAVLLGAIFLCLLLYALKEKRALNFLNIMKPKSKSWYDDLFR